MIIADKEFIFFIIYGFLAEDLKDLNYAALAAQQGNFYRISFAIHRQMSSQLVNQGTLKLGNHIK